MAMRFFGAAGWLGSLLAQFASSYIRHPEPAHIPPWLSIPPGHKRLLHVGCGSATKEDTVPGFMQPHWHEIRLDANEAVQPDIVASMLDMPMVPDGFVDAIFSSHNIEHLYPNQVQVALSEFHRVLDEDGFLVITCPDLQAIAAWIADDKLDDVAYVSSAGPVRPLDMVYGMQSLLTSPHFFMAHRCGFTLRTLIAAVQQAGFSECYGVRRPEQFDLWLLAHKRVHTKEALAHMARDFIPE